MAPVMVWVVDTGTMRPPPHAVGRALAALDDGRTFIGGVKWNRKPLAAEVFTRRWHQSWH